MTNNINLDGKISVSVTALVGAVAVIVGAVAAGSGFIAVKVDTLGRVVIESANNSRDIAEVKAELAIIRQNSDVNRGILEKQVGK